MIRPYRSRILLRDPLGNEVELARFPRAIHECDRKFWLRDLAPEWEIIEQPPPRRPGGRMPQLHVDALV